MIRELFRRKPDVHADLFAEAQALLDDGLEVDFILALYPDDADWLEPLLRTADHVSTTIRAEEPSFFFEASLKNRFIAAGVERARDEAETTSVGRVRQGVGRLQTAAASMAVVGAAATIGVLTLGFVTADEAVPGDWNYNFKRAGERVEYVLASEPQRVNVELRHKQERVTEMERMLARGTVTPEHIERLYQDLQEVAELGNGTYLEPHQQAHVRQISENTTEVLNTVRERQPELADDIEEAMALAAGIGGGGGPSGLDEPGDGGAGAPAATRTPTSEPTDTATPEPTATVETPEPTATTPPPTRTSTPDPTATRTPGPTRTPTPEDDDPDSTPAGSTNDDEETTEGD